MKHIARKRFGQHFLSDAGIIDAIVREIAPQPGQPMVEIGPGLAALTQPLVERLGRLTVIELDRDLAARLRQFAGLHVIRNPRRLALEERAEATEGVAAPELEEVTALDREEVTVEVTRDPARVGQRRDPIVLGGEAHPPERDYFAERVALHAETLNVKPRSISIKDMRSRCGSCSSEGRLNFTWRLVCAPPFARDYVAAHEVAHLKEMNHSNRFWKQVEKCFPDWKEARTWLHERGSALHAIGDT